MRVSVAALAWVLATGQALISPPGPSTASPARRAPVPPDATSMFADSRAGPPLTRRSPGGGKFGRIGKKDKKDKKKKDKKRKDKKKKDKKKKDKKKNGKLGKCTNACLGSEKTCGMGCIPREATCCVDDGDERSRFCPRRLSDGVGAAATAPRCVASEEEDGPSGFRCCAGDDDRCRRAGDRAATDSSVAVLRESDDPHVCPQLEGDDSSATRPCPAVGGSLVAAGMALTLASFVALGW